MRTATVSPALSDDAHWSSSGLGRRDAIGQWQDWAARTIAPIDVSVRDVDSFVAGWRSYGLGDLRFLHLLAPAQRVIHRGTGSSGQAAPSIQLVYARRGALKTQIGRKNFTIGPGAFVLLDNTRFYQMDMDSAHEAIDLMMPRAWIEHWLPDPDQLLGRPLSTRTGWGAPLGSLLEAMARQNDDSPLMRPLLAERVGALLTLAAETGGAFETQARGGLVERILRRIERDFADPELGPQPVADTLGISKRYLQALLAARGTSFVQQLAQVRLERACNLLSESSLPIAEIGFRCGFLDPGYFGRQFRRRFGATPREWRARR